MVGQDSSIGVLIMGPQFFGIPQRLADFLSLYQMSVFPYPPGLSEIKYITFPSRFNTALLEEYPSMFNSFTETESSQPHLSPCFTERKIHKSHICLSSLFSLGREGRFMVM